MDETVKRTIEAAIKALDAENTWRTFADKNADYKAGYNDAINALRYIADTLEDDDGSDERKRNESS